MAYTGTAVPLSKLSQSLTWPRPPSPLSMPSHQHHGLLTPLSCLRGARHSAGTWPQEESLCTGGQVLRRGEPWRVAHASSMTPIHTRQPRGQVTLPAQGAHQPGLRSLTLFYTDSDVREVLMNVLEEPELGRCQKCPGHNFPYSSPCSGETHPWEHPLHEASQPLRLFSLPASSRA